MTLMIWQTDWIATLPEKNLKKPPQTIGLRVIHAAHSGALAFVSRFLQNLLSTPVHHASLNDPS